MRVHAIAAALAAASISTVAATGAQTQAVVPTEAQAADEREVKRRRKAVAAGTLIRFRRSRGPQAKPKKRPNRAHIGKRVRRKHRRAA